MKNYTRTSLVSLFVAILFLFVFVGQSALAEELQPPIPDEIIALADAAGLTPAQYLMMQYIAELKEITIEEAILQYGTMSLDELTQLFEDMDTTVAFEELLTDEQLLVLETAFTQMRSTIQTAETSYHSAIKALKDTFRDQAQSATKEVDGDALAESVERLKTEILLEYAVVQQALTDAASKAQTLFIATVEKALVPRELYDPYTSWHQNKEENIADELTRFLDTFKQNASNGQGQGKSDEAAGQQNKNGNLEQNQEMNENMGTTQNMEQEKQDEQNGKGNPDQGKQKQSPGNAQTQGKNETNPGKGKGKGDH